MRWSTKARTFWKTALPASPATSTWCLTGYGFPLWRGGPMHYAGEVGLFNVVQAMGRFAQNPNDDAKFWQPAPLLAKLAAEGKQFS
jgi:3-hydroxyacyl-CoA dehydrogenase